MRTVRHILEAKGYDVWAIGPAETVHEALQLMAEKNVGALMVVEGESLVGILSERDYARRVELNQKTARDTLVKEIMTEKVVYIRPERTVQECMALMTDKHIRHLPVFQDDRLVGVISIGDVVKDVIAEQQFMIDQLESYISGGQTGQIPPVGL
jgi:CBS domain-containing protein